jgi:hypothetical protein
MAVASTHAHPAPTTQHPALSTNAYPAPPSVYLAPQPIPTAPHAIITPILPVPPASTPHLVPIPPTLIQAQMYARGVCRHAVHAITPPFVLVVGVGSIWMLVVGCALLLLDAPMAR